MVTECDMKCLIAIIKGVEMCYSSLAEVGQLSAITMTHIDQLSDRLPLTMQKEWTKIFEQLSLGEQIHPFPQFMIYLEAERKSCKRLAARQEQKDRSMSRGNAVRKKGSVFQVTTGDSELLEPDPPHYCIDNSSVSNATSAECFGARGGHVHRKILTKQARARFHQGWLRVQEHHLGLVLVNHGGLGEGENRRDPFAWLSLS